MIWVCIFFNIGDQIIKNTVQVTDRKKTGKFSGAGERCMAYKLILQKAFPLVKKLPEQKMKIGNFIQRCSGFLGGLPCLKQLFRQKFHLSRFAVDKADKTSNLFRLQLFFLLQIFRVGQKGGEGRADIVGLESRAAENSGNLWIPPPA